MFIKALCAQHDKQSYSKCHPWHPYGTRNDMKKHVRFSSNTFFFLMVDFILKASPNDCRISPPGGQK